MREIAVLLLAIMPAGAQIRAFPSNESVGIDIDRFIGNPFASLPKVSHEVMLTRSILRAGDPHVAGDPAAVLEYRKNFAVATLLPLNRTPITELPEQQIYFVESGQGRLDNGTTFWELRHGIAILIPPKAKHRFVNTAQEPLQMLQLSWENPSGVTPRNGILVRDVNLLPIAEKNAHWSYMAKNIFHPSDGLHPNEKILIVYLPPMTIGSPHPHPEHWEEVWTKLPPGDAHLMLGSEIREMPANAGFIAPPNGKTVHSVINISKDQTQAFFYFARYTHPAPDYKDEHSIAGRPLTSE